jgi:hypothetical protein
MQSPSSRSRVPFDLDLKRTLIAFDEKPSRLIDRQQIGIFEYNV